MNCKNIFLSIKNWVKTHIRFNWYVFIYAVVYTLMFNLQLYRVTYSSEPWMILKATLFSFTLVYFLFILFSWNRFVFAFFSVIFWVIAGVATYFIVKYKTYINQSSIAIFYETHSAEAKGVIGIEFYIWFAFILALTGFLIWHYFKKGHQRIFYKSFLGSLIIFFLSPVFLYSGHYLYRIEQFSFMPASFFQYTTYYLNSSADLRKMLQNRVNIADQNQFKYKNQDLTVVVLVGESLRADHLHINGYNRETTPYLEKDQVISFKNYLSCAPNTRMSVPCMLTRATSKNMDLSAQETSFISIFKKMGFYTAWFSNQGYTGQNNNRISAIAHEADYLFFNNPTGSGETTIITDDVFLPELEKVLKNEKRNQLVVMHTIGSHHHFEYHYTDGFRKYQPVCNRKLFCSAEQLTNSYDNTILFTDYFFDLLVKALESRNALIFYSGDHGEFLGENGMFGHDHGMENSEERRVPMLVWASEKYKKLNPQKYQTILQNNKKFGGDLKKAELLDENKNLSHDNLFYSVLDCSGIEGKIVTRSMSVCSQIQRK